MISILRASQQGEELRYPSKHEVTAMAKRLVEYYPMLQDKDEPIKHVSDGNFSHIIFLKSYFLKSCVIFKMFFSISDFFHHRWACTVIFRREFWMWSPHRRGRGPDQREAVQPKDVTLTSLQVTREKIMMQTQVVDQQFFCHLGAVLKTTVQVSENV